MTYKELIDTFINQLAEANTIETVEDACKGYVNELRERFSLASMHRYLTLARKAVDERLDPSEFGYFDRKASKVRHEAVRYLVKSEDEKDSWKEVNLGRVLQTQENQVSFTNPQEVIDRAIEQLDSPHYSRIAAGLLLLSGRRPIEVLKSGDFTQIGTHLYFEGQAKTKDRADAPEGFEIPVLCDPSLFLSAFERLRELKDCSEMTNEQVNRNVQPRVVEKVQKIFTPLCPAIESCSDLRKVYAAVTFYRFQNQGEYLWVSNGRKFSKASFMRAVLGHGDKDTVTAQSYEKFEILKGQNDLQII